jgi:hypothetical protein
MRDCGKVKGGILGNSLLFRRKTTYSRKCAHKIRIKKKRDPGMFRPFRAVRKNLHEKPESGAETLVLKPFCLYGPGK